MAIDGHLGQPIIVVHNSYRQIACTNLMRPAIGIEDTFVSRSIVVDNANRLTVFPVYCYLKILAVMFPILLSRTSSTDPLDKCLWEGVINVEAHDAHCRMASTKNKEHLFHNNNNNKKNNEAVFCLQAKKPLPSGSYEHRVPKIKIKIIFLYQGCLSLCDSTS